MRVYSIPCIVRTKKLPAPMICEVAEKFGLAILYSFEPLELQQEAVSQDRLKVMISGDEHRDSGVVSHILPSCFWKSLVSFLFSFFCSSARAPILCLYSVPEGTYRIFFFHIRLSKESVSIKSYVIISSTTIHCYSLGCISSMFFPPPLKPLSP